MIIKRAPWQCPTFSAWANRSTLQLTIFAPALLLAVLLAGCQTSTPQQQFEYSGTPSTAASFDFRQCGVWRAVLKDPHWYGDATVLQHASEIVSRCGMQNGASSEPPPASFATPPSASTSSDEIPIERSGGAYVVPVRINQTITLPFILDPGAEELVIPVDVALTLMRAGALTRSDFIGKARYTMANGSEAVQERVVIHEVQVGNHTATDVTATVSPVAGSPLLGESFLSKFGTVTIDYNRLVLILSH